MARKRKLKLIRCFGGKCPAFDLDFYDFGRMEYRGIRGYYYKLDKLRDKHFDILKQYQNVAILYCSPMYAPEIKRILIFVGDKCFPQRKN